MKIDPELIIPDKRLSINKGGHQGQRLGHGGQLHRRRCICEASSEHYHFSLDTPVGELPAEIIDILLYGTKGEKIKLPRGTACTAPAAIWHRLRGRHQQPGAPLPRHLQSNWIKEEIESYMSAVPCDACHGQRLSPESLAVTVGGMNISQFCRQVRHRGPGVRGRSGPHRPGEDDRRPHPQGDQVTGWAFCRAWAWST